MGYTQFLNAIDYLLGPTQEIVVAGDLSLSETRKMIGYVHRTFLPNKALLLRPNEGEGSRLWDLSPFIAALRPLNNKPTVYLCKQFACESPITDLEKLATALAST
jgi:hypothetical protein